MLRMFVLPLLLFAASPSVKAAAQVDLFSIFKFHKNTTPYIRHFQYPVNTVFNAATYALIDEGFAIASSNLVNGMILGNKEGLDVKITLVEVPFWYQETTTVHVYITDFAAGGASGVVYPDVSLYISILNKMRQHLLSA